MKKLFLILVLLTLVEKFVQTENLENSLEHKIEKLIKEVKELKEWKENMIKKEKNKYKIKSDIIKEKEQIELLINRLKNNVYIKDKAFHLEKIYDSNKDGDHVRDLYKKCDKKNMILLALEGEEGDKLGIFIQEFVVTKNYEYIYEHCTLNEDFVFSLDKLKIYNTNYNSYYQSSDYLEYHYTPLLFKGHYAITEYGLDIYGAFSLYEGEAAAFKTEKYLDRLSLDFNCISNDHWTGLITLKKGKNCPNTYIKDQKVKQLEAFQVTFDK